MHESDAYYEEILYPLQNGVLLAACEAPFYLTGGTALHRHFFAFRYSDDLRNDQYAGVLVTQQQTTLKIDFVNDSAPRFGAVVSGSLFPRIDSLRNILSNKVTAIYPRAAVLGAVAAPTPGAWPQSGPGAARAARLGGLGTLDSRPRLVQNHAPAVQGRCTGAELVTELSLRYRSHPNVAHCAHRSHHPATVARPDS